jgi:hypothetical protein
MIRKITPSYFVVMVDFGRRGLEAVVQPELTRSNIIDRLRTGEYGNVVFIHHVADGFVDDVTHELVEASEQLAREMSHA